MLGHASMAYLFLQMSLYVRNDPDLNNKCTSKSKLYTELLYKYAEHSDQAKQMQYHYESIIKDFLQNINNMNQQ